MKTVFLDANVLFSAAHKPAWTLARLIKSRKANFVTSRYAVSEAERNLSAAERPQLILLLQSVRFVLDHFGPPPAGRKLRGKDIPILASAAMCGADILLTGDQRDFGKWFGRTIGGVKIVKTGDLAAEL